MGKALRGLGYYIRAAAEAAERERTALAIEVLTSGGDEVTQAGGLDYYDESGPMTQEQWEKLRERLRRPVQRRRTFRCPCGGPVKAQLNLARGTSPLARYSDTYDVWGCSRCGEKRQPMSFFTELEAWAAEVRAELATEAAQGEELT